MILILMMMVMIGKMLVNDSQEPGILISLAGVFFGGWLRKDNKNDTPGSFFFSFTLIGFAFRRPRLEVSLYNAALPIPVQSRCVFSLSHPRIVDFFEFGFPIMILRP